MSKRLWPVVLLSLCAIARPLFAQERDLDTIDADALRLSGAIDVAPALTLNRPDLFRSVDGSVLIHDLPVTVLLDGRRLNIGGDSGHFGGAPLDRVPLAFLSEVRVLPGTTAPSVATDAAGGLIDLRLRSFASGGEVGVFYGKSSGKYGREDFESYIVGGVGSDQFQISAGAAYQHSSGRDVTFSR